MLRAAVVRRSRGGRGRVRQVGRDAGRLRGAEARPEHRGRGPARSGQRQARQDPAAGRPDPGRPPAAQPHRQGAEARPARRL